MKGGYHICKMLQDEKELAKLRQDNRIAGLQAYCDVLKTKNERILKENEVLKSDKEFWFKECNEYHDIYVEELDKRRKTSDEAEKYKTRFAYAGGCSIGFAILWFLEAFIF